MFALTRHFDGSPYGKEPSRQAGGGGALDAVLAAGGQSRIVMFDVTVSDIALVSVAVLMSDAQSAVPPNPCASTTPAPQCGVSGMRSVPWQDSDPEEKTMSLLFMEALKSWESG